MTPGGREFPALLRALCPFAGERTFLQFDVQPLRLLAKNRFRLRLREFPAYIYEAAARRWQRLHLYTERHRVTFLVPPKGFQPLTATAAQLTEYGLPARPKSKADLARWEKEVRRAKSVTPPPFLTESHSRAYSTYSSNNWSGYVATGSTGAFHQAEAWYWEPTYYSSSCSTNAAVEWANLSNFQIMTFNKTQANGSGLNNFSNLRLIDMYDSSGILMSEPAPIESSPGGYFTVTQHHCS